MKHIYLSLVFLALVVTGICQPKMQATIKPGITPRTIDVYMKTSVSFSHRDEAMTFAIAIPASVTNAPTIGSSGVTANGLGAVTSINGLQPNFLINNLGTTQREVFVNMQTVNGVANYIYTFIFAGTAPSVHSWTSGEEQQIFSIQFNGCNSNCLPETEQLVSLPDGGNYGIAYWYFQPNTLGDITNYLTPFYGNPASAAPVNGYSRDGSKLSTVRLANSVALGKEPKPVPNYATLASNNAQEETPSAVNAFDRPGKMNIAQSSKADFQIFPNPVINGVANLQLQNQPKGIYMVKLTSALGQVVFTAQVAHDGGSSNHKIILGNVSKGYYIMEVVGNNGNRKSIKLIY